MSEEKTMTPRAAGADDQPALYGLLQKFFANKISDSEFSQLRELASKFGLGVSYMDATTPTVQLAPAIYAKPADNPDEVQLFYLREQCDPSCGIREIPIATVPLEALVYTTQRPLT